MSGPLPKAYARSAAFALAFDLAHLGLASFGRDRYLAVVQRAEGPLVLVSALAVFGLAVHLGAAFRVARTPSRPGFDRDARRLQLAAGVCVLAMLGLHVATWPVATALDGTRSFGSYARMRALFPTPGGIAVHALGMAGLALHVQQGGARLLAAAGRPRAAATALAGVLAAVLFVAYFDALAAFTIGRTFAPR